MYHYSLVSRITKDQFWNCRYDGEYYSRILKMQDTNATHSHDHIPVQTGGGSKEEKCMLSRRYYYYTVRIYIFKRSKTRKGKERKKEKKRQNLVRELWSKSQKDNGIKVDGLRRRIFSTPVFSLARSLLTFPDNAHRVTLFLLLHFFSRLYLSFLP